MGENGVASKAAIVTALAVLISLASADTAAADGAAVVRDVSPREAYAIVREKAGSADFVLLDVRTPREFAEDHIRGARLVDYSSATFRDELGALDKGKTYFVYCRTANRSARAAAIMKGLGFREIYHLAGGIVRWYEVGLPTVRSESEGSR